MPLIHPSGPKTKMAKSLRRRQATPNTEADLAQALSSLADLDLKLPELEPTQIKHDVSPSTEQSYKDAASVPNAGLFTHPDIQRIEFKAETAKGNQEEAINKLQSYVNIINDYLLRQFMRRQPDALEKNMILTDNETRRMAAEALEHHFHGPFSAYFGLQTVAAWAKADTVPKEYFDIIKDVLAHQAEKNELVALAKIVPTHSPSPIGDVDASAEEPPPPVPVVFTTPPNVTSEIAQEIQGIHPIPVNGDISFIPPTKRAGAFANLYATIRRSNAVLVSDLHERGYTHQNIIDLARDLELHAIKALFQYSIHLPIRSVTEKLTHYKSRITTSLDHCSTPKNMGRWMQEMLAVRFQANAAKNEAEEKRIWKDLDERLKREDKEKEARKKKEKDEKIERNRLHRERLAAKYGREMVGVEVEDTGKDEVVMGGELIPQEEEEVTRGSLPASVE